ncbi:MarR family winged helix-turn-helix transcriptional regulator [Dehalobacterium formicoaceticum]|uniref:MarR family transcriptional regulator n=1 Tax=Dehalobacterium formicoaceticum TaxID=51515 RepID=A0ABT1Y6Q2_9FIRM|nr:MarR family transcriptional regulator [Dehalobacterium formicoaceticum]MCR6545366.1 MarR family transcriptional regulator [Dehalobacterium formicoaceticum]
MEKKHFKELPGYWWVDTLSGKVVLHMASTYGYLEKTYGRFFSRWQLSQTKFNVLLLLYKNESMALWELGEELLVSRANISGLIDRLEKSGLVTREIDPKDRRSMRVKLTAEGKEKVAELFLPFKEYTEKVMSPLSDNEKEMLINLLQKIQWGEKTKGSGE